MSKKRLHHNKRYFDRRMSGVESVLKRVIHSTDKNSAALKRLRTRMKVTRLPRSIYGLSVELRDLLDDSGYKVELTDNKGYLNQQAISVTNQENFVRRSAINQTIVSICSIFEEFVRQVLAKYYEDDIRRLHSLDTNIKYADVVNSIIDGELLARRLAYKRVDSVMRGSLWDWKHSLQQAEIDLEISESLSELFLVRNAIVHNNGRATADLTKAFPEKYETHLLIRISDEEFEAFQTSVHKTATWIRNEYHRKHPTAYTNWDDENYGLPAA